MRAADLAEVAVVAAGGIAFFSRRVLRYLRYFQQEEYDGARYVAWWRANRAFDHRGSVVVGVAALLAFVVPGDPARLAIDALAAAALAVVAYREEDPRTAGKITLKLTERAQRIRWTASALHAAAVIACALVIALSDTSPTSALAWLAQLAFVQSVPFALIAATMLLGPGERARQKQFLDEARAILQRVDPYTIGITGSAGKTSTKTVLAHLLETMAPTFWPPRSINTPLGITREIRERMKPQHRFAVIEMGAYKQGSIRGLCDLVPPKAAIVTGVGIMHLERFGSPENVLRAKSELAQSLPPDGVLVCNGDDEGARTIARRHPSGTTLLYGYAPIDDDARHLDCAISDVVMTPDGTRFTLQWKGARYDAFTKILGRHLLANIAAAFTMAAALGADPERLVAAIRNLPAVDNRLEPVREGDALVLRDAYNSNPSGFAAALDVLAALPGRRKLLMTPGMVELGPRQDVENRLAATRAAAVCDHVIVVGALNRAAIVEGLSAGGLDASRMTIVDTRDAAFAALRDLRGAGDVILIENDLPDVLEDAPRF